ncbi:MAG: ribonuclease HI [Lachnospiraceae bacterium]|nr:ribonuclease HI [Lachnospiraceae bacterium]
MNVTIYSDGSSRGNPGPGGFGTVLHYVTPKGELVKLELSQGYVETTNNRMELMGVISGLEALNRPCDVKVVSDSQYVIKAFNEHWIDSWVKSNWKRKSGPVLNSDLWKRLLKAMEPHKVSFEWIKGHAGHPENERCDELATKAADEEPSKLLIDEGYVSD